MDWGSLSFRFTLVLGQFARWLYRGQRPNALARMLNRGAAVVFARGVAPNYLVTLELTGRCSGRRISLPLVMTVRDRERYLVSHLGADVAWVQNVNAAAGRAVLRHGRTEHVRLEELAIEKRAPVLKAHLQRTPGARPHIPVDKDAPLEEFEAVCGTDSRLSGSLRRRNNCSRDGRPALIADRAGLTGSTMGWLRTS
jgi:hypothetical protein